MTDVLLDMCIDRRVGPLLAARGHDVVHVGDLGMSKAADTEVMAHAAAEGRVVVTHDSDFAALLARSGAGGPSVVRVRMPTAAPEEIAAAVGGAVEVAAEDLAAGAVVSVSEAGARVRSLPIQKSAD